jgi:hypothetical protein
MSSQSVVLNTGQQAIINTERSKIFIWNNRYDSADYTNGGGSPVTLAAGTLLGRISATGKVIPLASAAADGSQFPLGILADDYTVAAGATVKVYYGMAGDVAEEKVILAGSDTLETVVSGQRMRDRITSYTGIKLVKSTDLTNYDNS